MIERENNGATLSKVEVNASGGTLSIKSSHLDSLILAVEQAGNTGWNRVLGAEAEGEAVTLTLSKTENSSIHLPTLRGSIRRNDLGTILTCNSEELVSYSEGEYVPEEVNDIPPPELIQEEEVNNIPPPELIQEGDSVEESVGDSVEEELKPSTQEKPSKKASKKKTTEE